MPDPNVYSVTRVNKYIEGLLQEDFFLRRIMVRGEVSNLNKYEQSPSGHIYFQLKDENSTIQCKMWRSRRAAGLSFPLRNGDAVIVTGQVCVYPDNGTYYLQAEKIVKEGVGELAARFEELKRSLAEMGMFDPDYKKPIPKYARRVGIVTAPTGAAVRDIIRTAKNKDPFVELILAPTRVQGEGSAEEIAEAIARLDAMSPDVMIVGRGGGSLEDLWAFNEEVVARAIFACDTPVISAVGHEVDTTISDLVADYRAATPTAGAEAAVFDYHKFVSDLEAHRDALDRRMAAHLDRERMLLGQLSHRLMAQSPMAKVRGYRDRLISDEQRLLSHGPDRLLKIKRSTALELHRRLEQNIQSVILDAKHRSGILYEKLEGASPARRFAGGYSYVVGSDGHKLTDASSVSEGDSIRVYLSKGRVDAKVTSVQDDWGID